MKHDTNSMGKPTISRRELHAAHLQYPRTVLDGRDLLKEKQILVIVAADQGMELHNILLGKERQNDEKKIL